MLYFPISEDAHSQTISNISVDSAYALTQIYSQNPGFVILDVRTPSEYNAGHIENAVNLDFFSSSFGSILDSIDKNKIYLIHCGAGSRSSRARDSMAIRNFQTVYNMPGGYIEWKTLYPVTLVTTPVIATFSNENINFGYIPTGETKTIEVKITNQANDTLILYSYSGLADTIFSTDFSAPHKLLGYDDYIFHINCNTSNLNFDTSSIIINSNGGSLKFKLSVHGSALGVDDPKKSISFSVYPNPTTTYITVDSQIIDNKLYKLINQDGKVMKVFSLNKQKTKVDLSFLPPGLYFISNANQTLSFIKM